MRACCGSRWWSWCSTGYVWNMRGWAWSLHFIVHVPIHTSRKFSALMQRTLLIANQSGTICSPIRARHLRRLLLILTELKGCWCLSCRLEWLRLLRCWIGDCLVVHCCWVNWAIWHGFRSPLYTILIINLIIVLLLINIILSTVPVWLLVMAKTGSFHCAEVG